jgi:hypothetical protein
MAFVVCHNNLTLADWNIDVFENYAVRLIVLFTVFSRALYIVDRLLTCVIEKL